MSSENILRYDNHNPNEMLAFLKHIYKIYKSNPKKNFDYDIVYEELMKCNLSRDDKDLLGLPKNNFNLFQEWINHFKNASSINVLWDESWYHFCRFENDLEYSDNYIKIYIPVKYNNLKNDVINLFTFLNKNNIKHSSKVSNVVRSDNVIIRLDSKDTASLEKILEYIKNSNISLNKPNPFVPTINGIGYMIESGISYNMEMAKLIDKYTKQLISTKEIPNIMNFINFFNANVESKEVENIFNTLFKNNERIQNNPQQNINYEIDNTKISLLLNALSVTLNKYNLNQVKAALNMILKYNDFSAISNGNGITKYRDELRKVFDSNSLKIVMQNFVIKYNGIINNDDELVDAFCNIIFNRDNIKIFVDACNTTLNKYDESQLRLAIINYYKNNDVMYFTRFDNNNNSINHRMRLQKIPNNQILNIIAQYLLANSITNIPKNENELINLFINSLSNNLVKTSR